MAKLSRGKFIAHCVMVRLAMASDIDKLCKDIEYVTKKATEDGNKLYDLIYTNGKRT